MGKRIKSYLVFAGLGYQIVTFAVFPLLLIIFGYLLSVVLDLPGYYMVVYLLPGIEIAMDAFIFEGVASKQIAHLEYLKTSKRGNGLMKNALEGGMFRMLISTAIILFVNYLIYHGRTGDIWNAKRLFVLLWFCVLIYVISMCMIVIARFFTNVQINCVLGFISVLLELPAMLYIKNLYVSFVIFLIIAVVVSMFSVKLVERRMKESYYDKTVKDGI